MKIESDNGEYIIRCYMKYTRYDQARKWCREQFGDNWGVARLGQLDRFFGSENSFVFKRLYHAQWFLMRWND